MIYLSALLGFIVGLAAERLADRLPGTMVPPTIPDDATVFRDKRTWLSLAVALLSALLFAYLGARFTAYFQPLVLAALYSFFLLVALIDLKYGLVLNVLIYPAAGILLLFHALLTPGRLPEALLGGFLAFAVFWLTAWLRPGDLGGGDVKLAGFIGLLFGFPTVLWALLLGSVTGGAILMLLVLSKRWHGQGHVPYAPFLCLGAIGALLYNPLPLILPGG